VFFEDIKVVGPDKIPGNLPAVVLVIYN